MKRIVLVSALFLLAIIPSAVMAQAGLEDVVYLNNGSVLRGIIVEQVPNRSLKVQISGGSVFHVEMTEVARITKEATASVSSALRQEQRGQSYTAQRDTASRPVFVPRNKGYFLQGQILLELVQGGIRVVNGYKFGRFGHLGLGIGIDLSGPSLSHSFNSHGGGSIFALTGAYLPIYLQYSGEILNKKVTPFYALELGYAVALTGTGMYDADYSYGGSDVRGGAMGGLGIGVRFKTSRRINFSLLLNVNFKNASYREYYYWYDDIDQNYYSESQRVHSTLVYPGLRFGMGF